MALVQARLPLYSPHNTPELSADLKRKLFSKSCYENNYRSRVVPQPINIYISGIDMAGGQIMVANVCGKRTFSLVI
jgi:hypothetical protein